MQLNFVTGTAAELIKLYPVIRLSLQRGIATRVISSGQSRENFLAQYRDFALPEENLVQLLTNTADLERAGAALHWFWRAARVNPQSFRSKLLLDSTQMSYVIVHGDTLSTLVGAWLGWRAGVPVAHVEAGLRSGHLFNPFPEELTRRMVSRFARFHMAPDARAESHLRRVRGEVICTNGNTLMDAVLQDPKPSSRAREPFAIVNIHRFENLNHAARWRQIIETVSQAANRSKLIFVTHPQTRHKLNQDAEARACWTRPEIEIRDRMPFSEFIGLLHQAEYLISDGGSNQEECSYLGKPCLLLREDTERVEGLDGCCVLSRFDREVIQNFLNDPQQFARPGVRSTTSPSAIILNSLK